MLNGAELRNKIRKINGKGYKAYKDLEGGYNFGSYKLFIDHAQGDPFASPSRVRIQVDQHLAQFPSFLFSSRERRIALCDYLARCFSKAIRKYSKGIRGTGKSGLISIDAGKQEILERSAVVINKDFVEVRFVCGLPARGRTVLGRIAEEMLFHEIPQIVEASLYYKAVDQKEVNEFVNLVEDQEFIRNSLEARSLVAFIGNGAVLPRESGVSDAPMKGPRVVKFQSPPDLEVAFEVPNHGTIRGMGIPKGVTLIVGGGYHGKSTLLRAIERGVYNHIPGDGREWVITVKDAVKIRAEDGRKVERVDISPFINNLPFGQDTRSFSTEDASGSTSQAANIIEALEMGAKLLLIDEDTSATNFMIRDVRMQALVAKEKEPITPFLDKVRSLLRDLGVSTILVVGGSGDYFDVADTVIMMDEYLPRNVTEQAKKIALEYQTNRRPEGGEHFGEVRDRVPLPESFDPQKGRKVKVKAKGLETVQFGYYQIELDFVEQLVDVSQTRAIADIIYYAWKKYFDGRRSLREALELVERDLDTHGLDVISPFPNQKPGDYARPRKYEVAAAINRLRSLKVRGKGERNS